MKIKITLLTHGATAVIIATYASKRFKRLEHKLGKMNHAQYKQLMTVVPRTIDKLDKFQQHYENRVSYEIIEGKKASLFKELMDIYHRWYVSETAIEPKIDGISGKHLKQIIAYLRKQAATDEEVKTVFEHILNCWNELDPFFRNQRELRQINSNITQILNFIKNGKSDSKTQAKHVSDDFRENI